MHKPIPKSPKYVDEHGRERVRTCTCNPPKIILSRMGGGSYTETGEYIRQRRCAICGGAFYTCESILRE